MRVTIPNSLLSTIPDGEICNIAMKMIILQTFPSLVLIACCLMRSVVSHFYLQKTSTLKPNLNYQESSSNFVQ